MKRFKNVCHKHDKRSPSNINAVFDWAIKNYNHPVFKEMNLMNPDGTVIPQQSLVKNTMIEYEIKLKRLSDKEDDGDLAKSSAERQKDALKDKYTKKIENLNKNTLSINQSLRYKWQEIIEKIFSMSRCHSRRINLILKEIVF